MRDVACVLVNFNSGALCVSAIESLRAQRFPGRDGGQGSLQIVVVDNASPSDQRPWLDPLAAQGVEVIHHRRNEGYGGGMNLGMRHVDAEFVLLANPDILVLEGALDALVRRMRADERIGACGPRGYLDPGRFILLPPLDLPTLSLHVKESLGRVHRGIARRASLDRARRYHEAWCADGPREMAMVSGFAMFFRVDLARRLGPFDPHFPFYFEDADLCRRVRRAGSRCVLEPAAEMVHFFDQSARSVRAEVTRKYEHSRSYYYRKHYGRLGLRLFDAMNRYAARHAAAREGWRFDAVDELGAREEPPVLSWGEERDYVMEIATDPAFLFCGGHVGRGAELTFPPSAWNALEATRWYVRVLDRDSLRRLRYVVFDKTRHATGPISFEQYRERFQPEAAR